MIGVFDSGAGGLVSYRELRRLLPSADIVYLADRRNCPYGTKSKDELVKLVETDIKRLVSLGAAHILIACCTASTVYDSLSAKDRAISTPIISPTADFLVKKAAQKGGEYRITVIATERTISSHSFKKSVNNSLRKFTDQESFNLNNCLQSIEVSEMPAQELVSLVEEGNEDGKTDTRTETFLDELTKSVTDTHPDALVLGCTHFSRLRHEFERRLPDIITVSPAHIGAHTLYQRIKEENTAFPEQGKCLYTE